MNWYVALVVPATLLFAGLLKRRNFQTRYAQEVKSICDAIPEKPTHFDWNYTQSIPIPIQRYLKYAIRQDDPQLIQLAFMKYGGKMALKKESWMDMKCEQYWVTSDPSYVWKGSTGKIILVRDKYIEGKGEVWATIAGIFTVAFARDHQTDIGACVRFLAEAVFFPTFFADKRIQWEHVDVNTAVAKFHHCGIEGSVTITVNESGEITKLFSTDRCITQNGTTTKQPWSVTTSNYVPKNGFMVPKEAVVTWHLPDGDYQFIKLELEDLQFKTQK